MLKRQDEVIAIGMRAAAKLMVQAMLLLLVVFAGGARAQQPTPAAAGAPSRPFEILDNSFLVEEAFNQETGIFQNIFSFVRGRREWELVFTQEWPIGSQTHQLSYTLPLAGGDGASGVGDALLNYRYQLWTESGSRPAFSPRFSLVLPTGGRERGLDALGYQVNLPFSKQYEDFYLHWNGGFISFPGVEVDGTVEATTFFTPHVSGSLIWRARPMIHPMLEAIFRSEDSAGRRASVFTLSPGVRVGKNFADHQMVMGVAVPVTFDTDGSRAAVLLYFSYELPFKG